MHSRPLVLLTLFSALASTAVAQGPVRDYAPSIFTAPKTLPFAGALGSARSVELAELTGDPHADVLTLNGTQMSLVRNAGRYEIGSSFGSPSNACTVLPSAPLNRVLSAEAAGLFTYSWNTNSFSMANRTQLGSANGGAWTNCDTLDVLTLGTNTYVVARQSLTNVSIGRIDSSNQVVGTVSVSIGWVVSELLLLDWNADGSPEIVVSGVGGLKILNAQGAASWTQGGNMSLSRIARMPRVGGDRVVVSAFEPAYGLGYVTLLGPPAVSGGQPLVEPQCWMPMQFSSSLAVADYDMDGGVDVLLADATPGQSMKQVWIARRHVGYMPEGTSSFYFDMANSGGPNHFVLNSTPSATPILLAAGDYDNDGDPDVIAFSDVNTGGSSGSNLQLLPSATTAADTQWARIDHPNFTGAMGQGGTSYVGQLVFPRIQLPATTLRFSGVDANSLDVVAWIQASPAGGGIVDPNPVLLKSISLTSSTWNARSIPLQTMPIEFPNLEDQILKVQYTLTLRAQSGQLIASGPTLVGDYEISGLFPGSTHPTPDILPENQGPGSNPRPPSYPPRP